MKVCGKRLRNVAKLVLVEGWLLSSNEKDRNKGGMNDQA